MKFDQKFGLGFPLLADTDHAIADAYGVWGEKMNYGKTYMGIIRSVVPDRRGRAYRAGLVQGVAEGHRAERAEGARRGLTPPSNVSRYLP